MSDHLGPLLAYKRWANDRLFAVLSGAPAATLVKPRPIKFGSVHATAQHVYDMDVVWRAHLTGARHDVRSRVPENLLPISQLQARQSEMDDWLIETYADADGLDQECTFTFLDGGEGRMTIAEILVHLVNHGTYHRGHIADMLYHDEILPPITDYPVFLRDGRP